jgi:CheY-like chemotaxis protein
MSPRATDGGGSLHDQAAAWVTRLADDDVSASDRADFQEWLSASPAHLQAFAEVLATRADVDALAAAGRMRPPPGQPPSAARSEPPRRPRLLLVDDEAALAELLRRDLRKRGYDVVAHSAPVRAVEAFREDPASWAAVVTDAAMPGMSGFDVARAVLAIRPGTVVVVTSGWVDEGQEDAARAAGARAVLLKASTIEQYGREIDGLLRPLVASGTDAA